MIFLLFFFIIVAVELKGILTAFMIIFIRFMNEMERT